MQINEVGIKKEYPGSDITRSLIKELTSELAERYNFEYDGSGAFNVEDVMGTGSGFYVAWYKNEAIGCGALRPLHKNEIVEIKRMYVKPTFRRKGIALLILKHLEQQAKEMGYKRIWLETGDLQPEAIRLYQSSGYYPIESYGIYKENLHDNSFEKAID